MYANSKEQTMTSNHRARQTRFASTQSVVFRRWEMTALALGWNHVEMSVLPDAERRRVEGGIGVTCTICPSISSMITFVIERTSKPSTKSHIFDSAEFDLELSLARGHG
jgi:hypothetical protein